MRRDEFREGKVMSDMDADWREYAGDDAEFDVPYSKGYAYRAFIAGWAARDKRTISPVRANEQYRLSDIVRGINLIRSWYAADGNHDIRAVLAAAERYRYAVDSAAEFAADPENRTWEDRP